MGAIGFHFFLLHRNDVLLGKNSHVGGGCLLVEALAIGLGAECGAHEKNFAQLEIRVVHKREVFFAGDNAAQEVFGLLEEVEAFVLVAAIPGELVAALGGERDGKEVSAAFNGRARGKLLHVFAQAGGGLVVIGYLVFAEGTAINDGLEIGGLRILCNELVVALDRLLEDALAACIRGRKCHGLGGEDLRAQIVNHLQLVGSQRRTGLGFFQTGERLVEFAEIELADAELDGGRLDENIRGIASDDALVGGGGAFVVGV